MIKLLNYKSTERCFFALYKNDYSLGRISVLMLGGMKW